jgi:hypothetical protein
MAPPISRKPEVTTCATQGPDQWLIGICPEGSPENLGTAQIVNVSECKY